MRVQARYYKGNVSEEELTRYNGFGGESKNLGQNSIVGTLIRFKKDLPQHVVADEKHTKCQGEKAYIAATVANNWIEGVSPAKNADEPKLTRAYGVFGKESTAIQANLLPSTATTDGWAATQNAWKKIFPSIILISCFLHVFLKFRKNKRKFKNWFEQLSRKLWDCYEAPSIRTFSQRLRRLLEWCDSYFEPLPSLVSDKLEK